MSALATREASVAAKPADERPRLRLFEPSDPTLEDRILVAWEDLARGDPAECPVCGAEMRAAGGCAGCGSDLS